ncbi:PilZ domain-containing protein [Desulforhopalus sp. IMCC35007]|uniref:PilZ domain-containing protein n=1 Tax=Desulforhopalus sp. IMCC35007 TaxID=2569543 RepID=UPI0010AEC864|nr:PilZ domain-containing protein [Desulforhopalus sp. IMCC35007]TKB12225.1 PilZ domain-containing protein [Desulforhopalus sp. IMCC35007]
MDLRLADRKYLVFYLRVFDGTGNKILGHLVDISEKGVLLMTDELVALNEEHLLRLRLPAFIRDREEILLQGTCRWCHKDTNSDFFLTGFQIHDVDASTKEVIIHLMAELGYKEATIK